MNSATPNTTGTFNSRGSRRLLRELHGLARVADSGTVARYTLSVLRNARGIARSRSLSAADHDVHGEGRFTVEREKPIRLDRRYIGLVREIYARRCYTWWPGADIPPHAVTVDLGANAGVFSLLAATLGRRVVAVEAQSEMVRELRANVSRNGLDDKVDVIWALVGGDTGVLSSEEGRGAATHWGEDAPSLPLDDVLDRAGESEIDFLKADIEGSEFALFNQPSAAIRRVRRIAMEVHRRFGDPDEIAAALRDAGFDVQLADNDQRIVSHVTEPTGFLFASRRS